MTDQLEQELRDVLTGRAGDVGQPSFGGDAMVRRGRAARRRRQGLAIAGTAAAVVMALVVGGALFRPTTEALPPAEHRETRISLELVSGDEIVAPDGKRTPIGLPKGHTVGQASRVPGGWVVESTVIAGGTQLWFRPQQGPLRLLSGEYEGNHVISADGRRIAISGDPGLAVTLRELPSGRELARTTYQAALGPLVSAIVGDQVVLQEMQGGEGPLGPGFWNVGTGVVTRYSNQTLGVIEISADGTRTLSLRDVDSSRCGVFGTLDELVPDAEPSFCEPSELFMAGKLSPDGELLAGGTGPDLVVADVDQSRADRRVVKHPLGVPKRATSARALVWENSDWLIVEVPSGDEVSLLRCAANGDPCEPVAGPRVGFNAVVPRYGS